MLDTDTLYALAAEVRTLVSSLAKTSRLALDRRLNDVEPRISGLQYFLLCALSSEQLTLAELSRRSMRTPSTLVPAIDALERKALVQRGQDPDDRRRNPICLTEGGRRLLDRVPYVHESDPAVQGLQAMGEDRAQRLLALLCEWVGHLPGGREIVKAVEAQVRMYSPLVGKEVSSGTTVRRTVCRYCWAPDGFEPCPRRRIVDG